ncbi:spermidine/putrescine transport system ATP-binding protein [Rhodoligotrophos appendicifer]|uniref:ABC transporter ATP-binding protein n=1 Tax=Rhodoligotrophos appendicifer TaxID=987056 RepID=UPI00118482C2|nr:ABC transporter ATP-binding protein [Rhodoligotrophos appendicifer]
MFDLECIDVTKRFGPVTAVSGVSLDVPSGTFFSILGPSGCGKTTLMRMIAGFETPSAGDIRIKGKSVVETPPNKRNVKMVFQHLALFPMMDVGENIAYGLRCRGDGKADIARKVKSVLERVGLPDAAERQVNQLSGGQRQRVAIARCMVLEPDVLLLDEPLGALDLKLREHMKIELKLLQSQFDTTFLYITHDQSEALVMSDRVAVMNAGIFEQVGTPQELYHHPRSSFVAGFVGDSNRWSGRVVRIDKAVCQIELEDKTRVLATGHDALSVGDRVDVFVRPEALRLSSEEAQDGCNHFVGTLDSLLFNGANSRLLVRTASGMVEVDSRAPSDSIPAAGSPIAIASAVDKTLCFPQRDLA